MKVGDTVPVALAGHVVAQAQVKELSDGKAVLIIPATQVVMAVRTELDAVPAEPKETETVITGAERAEDNTAADVQTAEQIFNQPTEQTDAAVSDNDTQTADQTAAPQPTEVQSAETQVANAPVEETAPVEPKQEQLND